MSTNTNTTTSVLVKNLAPHNSRFLHGNLAQIGSHATAATAATNMINLNNVGTTSNAATANGSSRRLGKPLALTASLSSLPPAAGNTNGGASSTMTYQSAYTSNVSASSGVNSSNSQATTAASTFFPSMMKNQATAGFNANKKYSGDYQQAIRFDYPDVFLHNHQMEFVTRVSQMQRLQLDTVEWERKKKMCKKKTTKNTNGAAAAAATAAASATAAIISTNASTVMAASAPLSNATTRHPNNASSSNVD